MRPRLGWASVVLLFLISPASAQYMYLDTNGNGVYDSFDGRLDYPGIDSIHVYLVTNKGRDGLADACAGQPATPLDMNSYTAWIRVVTGVPVNWVGYASTVASFSQLNVIEYDWNYYVHFGAQVPLTPGKYKLGYLLVEPLASGAEVALQRSYFDTGDLPTTFGSSCPGLDFDNTLKLGQDWHDADPIYTFTPGTWQQDGVALSSFNDEEGDAEIVSDGAGGAVVVWGAGTPSIGFDLYAQAVDATGSILWPENGVPVATASGDQSAHRVARDTSGGYIIAYQNRPTASGPWDIYAVRLSPMGGIASGWSLQGKPLCTAPSEQQSVQVGPDASGGAYVLWQDLRSGEWDVYLHRVNGDGTIPVGWPTDGLAICTATNNQTDPRMLVDHQGNAIITWTDQRSGQSDIYAQKILPDGTRALGWPLNGLLVSGATSTQTTPFLVHDGIGGAIVAWNDTRNGLSDVYAQRVLYNATMLWAADVNLSPHAATQAIAGVCSDGRGGAIVVWRDTRFGSSDLFGNRVDGEGVKWWGATGDTICLPPAPATQERVAMLSDGANGAVLAWLHDGDDVYAQRVDFGGNRLWGPGGRSVVGHQDQQNNPSIASDAKGGAIVAWEDFRAGDWDPYVMRIGPQGGDYVTSIEAAPRVGTVALLPNVPNPFNPHTVIRFQVATPERVSYVVYDSAGRRVRELLDGMVAAGYHEVPWDGRAENGQAVASGIYHGVMKSQSGRGSQKLVVLR